MFNKKKKEEEKLEASATVAKEDPTAETIRQIMDILDVVRPYLNNDGGDIEFRKFQDGIVYVHMTGACMGCMGIESTLNDGIGSILIENVPGVIGVENVEE